MSRRAAVLLTYASTPFLVLAATIGINYSLGINERRYQRELQRYSREFAPGMTRAEVEARLPSLGGDISRLGDVYRVELGEDGWSLWCAPASLSIALDFAEQHLPTTSRADLLREIRIAKSPGACM